jgi:UDP-N-acetylglucosamine 2-epimerase (non-hydrolysing)
VIIFVYGTTAEAIKLAPISRRLDVLQIPHEHWLTYQHTEALRTLMPVLGLPEPTRVLADGARGRPLKMRKDVLVWGWSIVVWTLRNLSSVRRSLVDEVIVVVHGDTMTSVVGAFLAKLLGKKSAHVEAGLRSGNWRHPFPEELDRRVVGRLASVHYVPSPEAQANLRGRSGVVFTHGNTVIDAVLDGQKSIPSVTQSRGVVLLHRFEFISHPTLIKEMVEALLKHSRVPLSFIVDVYSRGPIEEILASVPDGDYEILSKLAHQEFVELLGSAAFVVTDSGGIQEEASLIGVPTLVHRVATERQEGIGRNVLLSLWDIGIVTSFLKEYEGYRFSQLDPKISPSDLIVDDLIERGYAGKI